MRIGMKTMVATALAMTATVAIAASKMAVSDVNERVAKILAPFNNEATEAVVKFTALDVNDVNVLKFGVQGLLAKVGKVNSVKLAIPNLNYDYKGPNGVPAFVAEGQLEMDFLKTFPQNFLNDIAESVEEMITDVSADFLREYGEAATIEPLVDVTRNEAGNVVAMNISVNVQIDLSKLPESIPVADAALTNLNVSSRFDLQGGNLRLAGELNPKYKGFSDDTAGLKEVIEALLNNDKATYEKIGDYVGTIDGFAKALVDRAPEKD